MNNTSNTVIYASLKQQSLQGIVLANGLAANTITSVVDAASTSSAVNDLLFMSTSTAALTFEIIICATGQQATAPSNVQISIPANSGKVGVALASLASLCPQLFSIDLAGNRVIGLEAGQSIYVKNVSAISIGQVVITKKVRDF